MNLFSPFDPGWFGSKVFPAIIPHLEKGQYEGYSYLGAGVLALAIILAAFALRHRERLHGIDKRWLLPLAACCLVLTLMALTTKIMAGSTVVLERRSTPAFFPVSGTFTLQWPSFLGTVLHPAVRATSCSLPVPGSQAR